VESDRLAEHILDRPGPNSSTTSSAPRPELHRNQFALRRVDRGGGSALIRGCYRTPDIKIVRVEPPLLESALALFEARSDKE
jgi:hypothetical protein